MRPELDAAGRDTLLFVQLSVGGWVGGAVGTLRRAATFGVAASLVMGHCLLVSPSVAASDDGELPSSVELSAEAETLAEAAVSGEPVPVAELTTEHQVVEAGPDGTLTAEVSAFPSRVMQDGDWVGVDASLSVGADGRVRPAATSVALELSGGGSGALVRMADGDQWLELSWPSSLPAPVLGGDTATYAEVMDGVDLVVRAEVTGFSHFLVVKTPEAAADPALRTVEFGLESSGLTPAELTNGAVVFGDAEGEDAFVFPQARMWDSSGAVGAGAGARASADGVPAELLEPDGSVSAAVAVEATSTEVALTPDAAMLTDPGTVFPVVIDPSYTRAKTYWVMVWSNGQEFYNEPTQARVGYDGWEDNKKSRAFYRFNVSSFLSGTVTSARFEHKQVHSPNNDCSLSSYGPSVQFFGTGPISGSTSWGGPGTRSGTSKTSTTVHGNSTRCGGWTRQTWDATAAVVDRTSEGSAGLTVRLRSSDESDRNGWRRYSHSDGYPKLIVNYRRPPSTPTNLRTTSPTTSCQTHANRPWINDNSPVLRAKLAAPDGQNLRGRFQRQRYVNGAWGGTTTTLTTYGAQGDRSVAQSGLVAGSYRWRVRAEDSSGSASSYSGWCYFELDMTPPPRPGLSISDPYEFEVWVERDGRPEATLSVTNAGDTGVNRFEYSIGSSTPGTTKSMSGTGTVSFTPDYGLTTVSARLIDRAGNKGPIATEAIKVMSPKAQHAWVMNDGTAGSTDDMATPRSDALDLAFDADVVWSTGNRADEGGEAWDAALQFNGTGDGALAAGAPLFAMDSFTVTARVKLDEFDSSGNFYAVNLDGPQYPVFKMGHDLDINVWKIYTHTTGRPGGAYVSLDSTLSPVDHVGEGGMPFPDGKPDWQHLALVYDADSTTLRLYVDSVLAAETDHEFTWAGEGPFRVGRGQNNGSTNGGGKGKVDDVTIFDSALDVEQIRLLDFSDTQDDIAAARDYQLEARWRFGDGTGTTAADSTGRGHDLTLGTGISWYTLCPWNVSLDGSASAYGQTANPVLDTTQSWSVTAWALVPGGASDGTVISQSGAHNSGMSLAFDAGTDRWRLGWRQFDTAGASWQAAYSDDPVPRNRWLHLAGVYDAAGDGTGTLSLYVSGQLQGVATGVRPWQATGPTLLGANLDGGLIGTTWDGRLDDIDVFQRALSSSELKAMGASRICLMGDAA